MTFLIEKEFYHFPLSFAPSNTSQLLSPPLHSQVNSLFSLAIIVTYMYVCMYMHAQLKIQNHIYRESSP